MGKDKEKEKKEEKKFQVGQNVKVRSTERPAIADYSGKAGKVVAYEDGDFPVKVKFLDLTDKLSDNYTFKESELEGVRGRKPKDS